jgi:hypothetical protein
MLDPGYLLFVRKKSHLPGGGSAARSHETIHFCRQVPGGADAGTGTVRPVAEGGAPAPRLLDRVPLRGGGRLRGLHTGMEEEIKEWKVVTIIIFFSQF